MQPVGLLRSAIERAGFPTVGLTFSADLSRELGVPRALAVRFPYGAPFGNPHNRWLQTRVLREALSLLECAPTLIRKSAYAWRQTRERVGWQGARSAAVPAAGLAASRRRLLKALSCAPEARQLQRGRSQHVAEPNDLAAQPQELYEGTRAS